MASVRLEGIAKRYGDFAAVKDLSLDIKEGEFVTFLGASGSGKTTCLRIIAGFVEPDAGAVFIGGDDVTRVPAHRRNTGMVFQHYALFPHLTVAQNVAFGLKVRRIASPEAAARTKKALELVHLEALADRYPRQLSGGQKQRVALARAVVIGPRVLLLDEPLAALDLKLREELQGEIKRVQQTLGVTTIFVTHDQGEALGLSDRVVVMRNGGILQVDAPRALYDRPNCQYVASFVGRTNFLDVVVLECSPGRDRFVVRRADNPAALIEVLGRQPEDFAPGDSCLLAFRPEDGRLEPSPRNAIVASVEKVTFRGDSSMLNCLGPGKRGIAVALPVASPVPALGSEIMVSWLPDRCILLRPDAGGLPA
jgi:ABC-type Fe3+/spermidine/putrescine transport system ATPase subunit